MKIRPKKSIDQVQAPTRPPEVLPLRIQKEEQCCHLSRKLLNLIRLGGPQSTSDRQFILAITSLIDDMWVGECFGGAIDSRASEFFQKAVRYSRP